MDLPNWRKIIFAMLNVGSLSFSIFDCFSNEKCSLIVMIRIFSCYTKWPSPRYFPKENVFFHLFQKWLTFFSRSNNHQHLLSKIMIVREICFTRWWCAWFVKILLWASCGQFYAVFCARAPSCASLSRVRPERAQRAFQLCLNSRSTTSLLVVDCSSDLLKKWGKNFNFLDWDWQIALNL